MDDKCIKLFANCLLCKGAKQAIIADVQKAVYYIIPNSLYFILSNYQRYTCSEIKQKYPESEHHILYEYFRFICEEKIGFLVDKDMIENFPSLEMKWKNPGIVTNAIYDLSETNKIYFKSFLEQLEFLQCFHLELRNFSTVRDVFIYKILGLIELSAIRSVTLYIKYSDEMDVDKLVKRIDKYASLIQIIVWGCSKKYRYENKANGKYLYATENTIDSERSCGLILPELFSINMKTYTEAQEHNSCLNRKIGIDRDGNIKNCPSMPKTFGHIKSVLLKEAIAMSGFKEVWGLAKDQIEVCRDCEFRYICTDCRAYTQDPGSIYSKPLKCGYNPYEAIWQPWTTNPLSQNAINFYGFQKIL